MGLFQFLGTLSPLHIQWFTWFKKGRKIGEDMNGNVYYQAPARKGYKRPRRWVIYSGLEDSTTVPPEWHGWLHYQTDDIPQDNMSAYRRPWQKPHQPNKTGTNQRYLPSGHVLNNKDRTKTHGDYEAWTPPE